MLNNDVLRRVRYALDLDDATMIRIFALAGVTIHPDELASALKKEDDEGFEELEDRHLDAFLNGLITHKRGKQEMAPDRPVARPARVTNNTILRQLRIALSLKDEDMLRMLARAEFRFSKGELSALFRQPGHKNYRECGDQILRNFLHGLALELRGRGA